MSQQHQAQLQEAYQLIKSGNKHDATRMLLSVLKQDRDSAEAWWLLANATTDPEKQRQALNQVLRVRPDHNAAQRLLEKVNASAAMRPASPPAAPAADPFAAPPVPTPPVANDPFTQPRATAPADDPFGDPFASPATRSSRAVEDDPFGDPFAASSRRVEDDPFGDPFAAPASRTADDDPFGDPFAAPAPRKRKTDDDPFTHARTRPVSDDPFASRQQIPSPERTRVVVEKKKGTNPLVIVLAVIGIIGVVACGLVAIAGIAGFNLVSQAVQTAMPEGTFQAAVEEFQLALTELPSGTLQAAMAEFQLALTQMPGDMEAAFSAAQTAMPGAQWTSAIMAAQTAMPGIVNENGIIGNIVEKGAIGFGTPIRALLEADGFTNHAYKFAGESGQSVTIELTALSDDFDVKLALLGPDGRLVAENDDIDFQANNLNSRIETTLPANGAYTVVVGDVGFGGGDYELALQ